MTTTLDYSFTTEAEAGLPVAIVAPEAQDVVVGAVVRLDGRASFSPTGLTLTYAWEFKQVPIGSQVLVDGFKDLESDSSAVSFAPDVTGLYIIQLVVSDGSFDSKPAVSEVNTKIILVPQNLGIVPDASWVWNFLSDFWTRVEQRARFESFWSGAIQVIAAEQLKLWQYDYNKSIKDIQQVIQKRWLAYEPRLLLDASKTSFILADDQAGVDASTFLIDTFSSGPQAGQPLLSNLVTVPLSEGSFTTAAYGQSIATGRLLQLGERSFTMVRASAVTRAIQLGTNGATTSGTNTFTGSAFSTGLIGFYLKLLTGVQSGQVFKIDDVPDSVTLKLVTLSGGLMSFAASQAGLSFSIITPTPNWSAFFADESLVPTKQFPVSWRFSSTLVSTEYDFESLGVSPGDVLSLQVTRTDTQKSTTLNVQIVAVDRGRVGFVFNTEDLEDGVASSGLSDEDQLQLALDLQVPGLSISQVDKTLQYTDQALQVLTTVQSTVFKRQFFEQSLTFGSVINVGPFSVTVKPLKILRNSKILIDSTIESIPSLQEYVKQPTVVERDGALFQISEDKLFPLSRQPYLIYENADYVLDNENAISGTGTISIGSDTAIVPFGDLVDRGIRQGDTITFTVGIVDYSFNITAIVDPETLRISPASPVTAAAVPFTISREVTGNFLRFVKGTFTKKMPAPNRLWAEVSFFDNEGAVEDNFGVLVGVLRSDLSSVGATISYKDAVAGLMYALTNGPAIANLQLASEILLGLPFTTLSGTIIEIDPEFKTRLDGSPLQGRILVSAEDEHGNELGITSIYFYPQGRQLPDPLHPGKWLPANPELSGLSINPITGKEYAVGDHVERFSALSKGTQVEDYLTNPELVVNAANQGNSSFAIQRYHSFRLIVNADITTAIDTDLVAQFIKKAKPTYVKLSLALAKALEDVVDVSDTLLFTHPMDVQDNVALSLPVAATLDKQSVDSAYVTTDGEMFSYRIFGSDLAVQQGSIVVTSASGGFTTARFGESHDGGFIRNGYMLSIIGGVNAGNYVVFSVDSDTQITLEAVDWEGAIFNFQTNTIGEQFVIWMPISAQVNAGAGSITNGSPTITFPNGIGSPGVAVGDLVVFYNTPLGTWGRTYRVQDFNINAQTIELDRSVVEATGPYIIGIYREGLLGEHFGTIADTPFGITQVNGSNSAVVTTNGLQYDPFIPLLMYPGDIIVNPTTAEEFVVLDFDPSTKTVYFEPAAANAGLYDVRLERQGRPSTVISTDILDRMPQDSLFLTARLRSVASGGFGPDLTTTNGSATVSTLSGVNFDTGLGVVAGDFLVVLENGDSTRDIGYGAGVFPILSVAGGNLTLTRPLTVTNNAPGVLFGIQRRRPNER